MEKGPARQIVVLRNPSRCSWNGWSLWNCAVFASAFLANSMVSSNMGPCGLFVHMLVSQQIQNLECGLSDRILLLMEHLWLPVIQRYYYWARISFQYSIKKDATWLVSSFVFSLWYTRHVFKPFYNNILIICLLILHSRYTTHTSSILLCTACISIPCLSSIDLQVPTLVALQMGWVKHEDLWYLASAQMVQKSLP